MEWKFTLESSPDLFRIRVWGDWSLEGFKELVAASLATPGWRPGLPSLWDFTQLDMGKVPTRELQALAGFRMNLDPQVGRAKVAYVVSSAVSYGLSRMWDGLNTRSAATRRVFYTEEEALAWLLEGEGT